MTGIRLSKFYDEFNFNQLINKFLLYCLLLLYVLATSKAAIIFSPHRILLSASEDLDHVNILSNTPLFISCLSVFFQSGHDDDNAPKSGFDFLDNW